MKILLFVINDYDFLMSHRKEILQAAIGSGYRVHIACDRIGDLPEFTYHVMPLEKTAIDPWGDLRYAFGLFRLMRALKPDVMHAVTIKPVLYGGLAARLAGIRRSVVSISGLGQYFTTRKGLVPALVRGLYRLLIWKGNTHFIFQNQGDFKALDSLTPIRQHSFTVGSGVDLARFEGHVRTFDQSVLRFLFASRLLVSKGVMDFHAAAEQYRSDMGAASAEFLVAGQYDPSNPDSITAADLQRLTSSGSVRFLGSVTDMPGLLDTCDVFVLPTRYGEGVPKAVLEAIAKGLPVIVSPADGCVEVVRDGVNGIVLQDTRPETIASAMRELARHRDRMRAMSDNNVALGKAAFSVEHVVRHHLELYRRETDP